MDDKTVAILVEAAKISLTAYFSYLQIAGKTEEEIGVLYEQEKKAFEENIPSELPDI